MNKTEYWDTKVKPLAEEVMNKSTVDKGAVKFFVGQMIFAVEHDLADGRFPGLMSLNCLVRVKGVFTSDSYFEKVHPDTSKKEIDRMKKLAIEINNLLEDKKDD